MPVYNVTIDDSTSFITYGGSWNDTPADSQASAYKNNTWHETDNISSVANFTFNGTGVYLYGAKRSNHGIYSVSVDDHVTLNNGSASPDEFQQLLYGNGDLPYGEHRVALSTTQSGLFVDLDSIMITTGDGDADTTFEDIVYDDNTPAFQYYGTGWTTSIGSRQGTVNNSTVHGTGVLNDSAQLRFNGNAVSLFGALSPGHGPFSASVDGAPAILLTGWAATYRGQEVLYRYDGLPDGDHTLTLINLSPDQDGVAMALDFAVATRYNKATSPSPEPPHGSGLSPGVLAGIVVAAVLALVAVAGFGVWLVRRRRSVSYKTVNLEAAEVHPAPIIPFAPIPSGGPIGGSALRGPDVGDLEAPPSYAAVQNATPQIERDEHSDGPSQVASDSSRPAAGHKRDRKIRPGPTS